MIDVDVPVSYFGETAPSVHSGLPHDARSLRATARLLETIAAFYLQFPTKEMFDMVCHESYDGLSPNLLAEVEEFRAAVCTSDLDTCGAEYERLFLETNAPCPLWESAWTGWIDILSESHFDVLGWYTKYGKTPVCAPYDPSDHIALEFAFAATLAWLAVDGCDVEADYDEFVKRHLVNWVPRFTGVLRRASRVALYQRLAALTLAAL